MRRSAIRHSTGDRLRSRRGVKLAATEEVLRIPRPMELAANPAGGNWRGRPAPGPARRFQPRTLLRHALRAERLGDARRRRGCAICPPVNPGYASPARTLAGGRHVRDAVERVDQMPIKIPDDLPARATLDAEGVMVMRETDAVRQDIRPLRIGLLNLMPNKIRTETQIARLLGATPLQVELTLVKMTNHVARNTPSEHIISFYRDWEDVRSERFDGFIVTGAPVETMPFEQVTYWDELRRIFDWTETHVHGCFNICWGAQAAVHHFHGMPKYPLTEKAFGVYQHRNLAPASPYLRGFSDDFSIPVSRSTEVRRDDVRRIAE